MIAREKKEKTKHMEQKANILKGLAHPVRIAIAEMLADDEVCACEIAEHFPVDRTTVSKHLALMTKLNILEVRRDGSNMFYKLKMKCLISVFKCLGGVIERGICNEED